MEVIKYPTKEKWDQLSQRPVIDDKQLVNKVSQIIDNVKNNGDRALREYSVKFEKVNLEDFSVSPDEVDKACSVVDSELKSAIEIAKNNITKFHESQREAVKIIETAPGVKCWRKSIAIEKVGLYVPGGTAPLFSTVLMLGIPAKLAGCEKIVLCTPPDKKGKIHPAILYCADLIGIDKIYKIGGSQAIAAMAHGTETVPRVYKIFGPGNQFVTLAKQLVTLEGVAIDMPAGPSEVAVVADESADPHFIAADLLSQAEHGVDSQVFFITTDELLIQKVKDAVEAQLKELPRAEIAKAALKNSRIILFEDIQTVMEFVNEYAPEHFILMVKDIESTAEMVKSAGSVFLGKYTPESAGDYASGTNHTLPTNGYARSYSGVSLDSFVKKITFQEISEEGLKNIGPAIETMAEAEQLAAHKNAVTVRLNKK